MNAALLRKGAGAFGLALDETAVARFSMFLDELRHWNRSVNLTAITQPDQIVVKHFIDSLSLVPLIRTGDHMLDVGSGAGLPGLAVAIVRTDVAITSLDAVEKKVRFQRHICRLLGLDQVRVQHGRVEQSVSDGEEGYDLVTSRAFSDIERFVQLAYRLVRPGGRLVAMTSGAGGVTDQQVVQWAESYGLQLQDVHSYELPQGMGARKLVVFERKPR